MFSLRITCVQRWMSSATKDWACAAVVCQGEAACFFSAAIIFEALFFLFG